MKKNMRFYFYLLILTIYTLYKFGLWSSCSLHSTLIDFGRNIDRIEKSSGARLVNRNVNLIMLWHDVIVYVIYIKIVNQFYKIDSLFEYNKIV
jgi:hypothetical protein